MILVDTSVWLDHLRRSDAGLSRALEGAEVSTHPAVIGELACGSLRNREGVLTLLDRLPHAPEATHAEALAFIDRHALMGRGVGYTDVHLLASAALASDTRLWTRDRRLHEVAVDLGMAYGD